MASVCTGIRRFRGVWRAQKRISSQHQRWTCSLQQSTDNLQQNANKNGSNWSQRAAVTVVATAAASAMAGTAAFCLANSQAKDEKDEEEQHVFVNWSASHECRPREFFVPETLAQLEQIVRDFHDQKRKLRCMGAGLSPNGLGFSGKSKLTHEMGSNEALVTLALFDRILDVNLEQQQVTVEAGVMVGDLLAKLREYGLTMQNVASIRDQHVGGIVQAGCHGTGAGIPPIDDQVVELEIVTPAKGRMVLNARETPELFALAKCGLGALGIVTKITLQCVPKHYLVEETRLMTANDVRANHTKWLREFQHLRYMWIPYTDSVVVVQCRRISDEEAQRDAAKYPAVSTAMDLRMEAPRKLYLETAGDQFDPEYLDWSFTKLRDKLLALNPLDKAHVMRVNESEKAFWKLSEGFRVMLSDDILGFDCGGQQLVQEVAFPVTTERADVDFVLNLMQQIDREDIPAHSPIEQRWTSRSTSAMSPVSSQEKDLVFSWVGVILYLPTPDEETRRAITKRFHEFYGLLKRFMEPYNSFEHWAKIEFPRDDDHQDPDQERARMQKRLAARYPLDRFKAARDEFDPHHILSNQIVDEICA